MVNSSNLVLNVEGVTKTMFVLIYLKLKYRNMQNLLVNCDIRLSHVTKSNWSLNTYLRWIGCIATNISSKPVEDRGSSKKVTLHLRVFGDHTSSL